MILGPSINVHRVARNGRNAEYLSGEDPHLGVALAPEYVAGVQGEGVAGVAKHYALNNQETRRDTISDDASERALGDLLPAIRGVGGGGRGVDYVRVQPRQRHARVRIAQAARRRPEGEDGFDGWVMSDWWAVHATDAAANGVDQLMPGNLNYFDEAPLYRTVGVARVDEMATRVLRGLIGAGAFAPPAACVVGCDCFPLIADAVATSPAHVALARRIGASATVLLKNDGAVLAARRSDHHRRPRRRVRLDARCRRRLRRLDAWRLLRRRRLGTRPLRRRLARGGAPRARRRAGGARRRRRVLEAALSAAEGADAVIACAGATTTESRDRESLRLDQHDLLMALGAAALPAPLIVVSLAPGAVEAPWAANASAVVNLFLGGQETGNAVADVLLGDVNPSARLPVTSRSPRWGRPRRATPSDACTMRASTQGGAPKAIPSRSSSAPASRTPCSPTRGGAARSRCRRRRARPSPLNAGAVAGADVPQLYSASPPRRASRRSSFADSPRRACWRRAPTRPSNSPSPRATSRRTTLGTWRKAVGEFGAVVGASSRDHRLEASFAV